MARANTKIANISSVNIKYRQLVFLYAYLRLIDLSLDRGRWGEWENFLVYFKNILSPVIIIHYLKESFDLTEKDLSKARLLTEKKTILYKLRAIIFKEYSLSRDEVLYCCKLLLDFDKILKVHNEDYNLVIERLRQDVAIYYTEILGNLIRHKDLKMLMRIEHFNKSDKVDVVRLNEFIPNDLKIRIRH